MRVESLKMYLGALISSGELSLSDGPVVIGEKIVDAVKNDLGEALAGLGKMIGGQVIRKVAEKVEKDGVGGLVDSVAEFIAGKKTSRKTVVHRPLDVLARRR